MRYNQPRAPTVTASRVGSRLASRAKRRSNCSSDAAACGGMGRGRISRPGPPPPDGFSGYPPSNVAISPGVLLRQACSLAPSSAAPQVLWAML